MLPVHALAPAGAEPAPFVAWIGHRHGLSAARAEEAPQDGRAFRPGPVFAGLFPVRFLPAPRRAVPLGASVREEALPAHRAYRFPLHGAPAGSGARKKDSSKKAVFSLWLSMAKARFSARGMACYIQEGISPAAVTPPPSGSRTGAAVRRSLRRGSCSSRYPPPSENNPSSRNERSPIFLMDTEIIAGSAHPGQQTAENIRKFSRRFRPDYTTFRPPRVNRRA